MNPFRFALREIRFRPVYAGLFALSIAGGTASLTALAGVGGILQKTVTSQARELWAGDITVRGSEAVLKDVETWARGRWPGLDAARTLQTLSMARAGGRAEQVTLSAVTPNYPLTGKIATASGRALASVLVPGSVVASEKLLLQRGLRVGDLLGIGTLELRIADVIARRTDVPTSFFELSPGALLTLEDLEKSGLVVPGSRSQNTLYLNLPPGLDLETALKEVKERAASETTEVAGWSTDNPGLFRFLNRVLLYLDFLALLTLTLGGVGAATALSAGLAAGMKSLGMVFALGAPRGWAVRSWLWWVLILAGAGTGAALFLARLMAGLLLALFGDLLPSGLLPGIPGLALAQAAGVGLASALLFTLLPLLKVGDVPPNAIFSDDVPAFPRRPVRTALVLVLGVGIFYLLVWSRLSRPGLALGYAAGLAGVLAAGGSLVAAAMAGLRRGLGRLSSLAPRLAARGLARPGNLNDAAVLSIALSLAVLVTLFLLQKNLRAQMIESFPPEAPNAFFINVQPSQAEGFRKAVGRADARLFPLVRGRVVSVNGIRVQDINRRARRDGDRLTREFGFTFGPNPFPTDRVSEGKALWDPGMDGPQVSVFDEYRDRFGLRRGDQLTVSILGRRFTATIASFRSINQSVRQPFFYFQFQPGLLEEVPHTLMGGLSVPREELPELQNKLADLFPNITVIDLSDVAALTGKLFARLGRVVAALGIFGLFSGVLLLLSSLLASLASRTREAALFSTLGATRGQVTAIALLEYALIGTTGALAAGIVGVGASGLLLRRVFDLPLMVFPLQTGGLLLATVAAIVSLSWLATRRALRPFPMEVLRHE